MAQRPPETVSMEAMIRRVLVAFKRRADHGDLEVVEALDRLGRVTVDLLSSAVVTLRAEPWNYSWTDIGNALGVTRQAAQKRFGHVQPPEEAGQGTLR